MGPFPKLTGQSSAYIVDRLNTYKNKGQVGAMSATMWAQAGMLSADQMDQIGKFIEAGLPSK
jgi:cytochrome c553